MLYNLHSLSSFWSQNFNRYAKLNAELTKNNPWLRQWYATSKLIEGYTRTHGKPAFNLGVNESQIISNTFGSLLSFGDIKNNKPNLLIIAPISGHHATLLRNTVWEFLNDYNVSITDWHDAAEIPTNEGSFDLNSYIDYLRNYIDYFQGDVHLMAVCQSSVPALAAVALQAEDDKPCPISMTLLGGPIDTRIATTSVGRFVEQHGLKWFRDQVIQNVPFNRQGAGRRVYPGFMQLSGLLALNMNRHIQAHYDYFVHLIEGDEDSTVQHENFYNEYLSVMDMDAPFYLDTIQKVFIEHQLPKGTFFYHNQRVKPELIDQTALMTIEGGKDDITAPGQTEAAHQLCINAPLHAHHVQAEVGHFGVFNGQRFRKEIAPRIRQFINQTKGEFSLSIAKSNAVIASQTN